MWSSLGCREAALCMPEVHSAVWRGGGGGGGGGGGTQRGSKEMGGEGKPNIRGKGGICLKDIQNYYVSKTTHAFPLTSLRYNLAPS